MCFCNKFDCFYQYRRFELKDSSTKKFLNFRLYDTCGFQEGFSFDAQEFSFIVCGNLPDCYRVILRSFQSCIKQQSTRICKAFLIVYVLCCSLIPWYLLNRIPLGT